MWSARVLKRHLHSAAVSSVLVSLVLSVVLALPIAYHPRSWGKASSLEEAEQPKIFMMYGLVGAVSPSACQIQGVWVAPSRRGTGLAGPGIATVVETARREIAPLVTLYVNDYNVAARATYRSIGMREVGAFASILF